MWFKMRNTSIGGNVQPRYRKLVSNESNARYTGRLFMFMWWVVRWLVGCWLEERMDERTEGGNKDQIDDLYLLEATMYLNRH